MNIEQERAAFEWWASDEGESPRATERAGGCYKLAQIQSYWVAWQARAALQAEGERLRKDAERYQWIRSIGHEQTRVVMHYAGSAMDSVIDAAMEGGDQ